MLRPSERSEWIDLNGGRPARILQWSIGLQREIQRNLVVEANYIGNGEMRYQANSLIDVNALTPAPLAFFRLNINNATARC